MRSAGGGVVEAVTPAIVIELRTGDGDSASPAATEVDARMDVDPSSPDDRPPRAKRLLDLGLGIPALVAATPLMACLAAAIWLDGRGPVLYRAIRVGEGGRPIVVLKFRTMVVDHEGPRLTESHDRRVTPVGRFLRRYRLDELPQLVNVVRGEMSLVGPRPEDPAYVDFGDPLHRRVFRARPGITGPAQLAFRDEADLLRGPDPERRYRDAVLPAKLRIDAAYLEAWSVRRDLAILGRTLFAVIGRSSPPALD